MTGYVIPGMSHAAVTQEAERVFQAFPKQGSAMEYAAACHAAVCQRDAPHEGSAAEPSCTGRLPAVQVGCCPAQAQCDTAVLATVSLSSCGSPSRAAPWSTLQPATRL